MIPRRFSWLFDSLVLALAFFSAYAMAPYVQGLFTHGGLFAFGWVEKHFLPPPASVAFPPVAEFLWILLATVPGVILFMELFGAYRRVDQSFVRTIVVGAAAPFLSLSLVALGLYAVKQNSWSRVFFFLYGIHGAALLIFVRVTFLAWRRQRRGMGVYSKNVVIIGSPFGLKHLIGHFREHLALTEFRLWGYLNSRENQPTSPISDVPCLGVARQLGELAVHHPIHEVMLVSHETDAGALPQVIKDCDYFHIALRIIPETLLVDLPRDLQAPRDDDAVGLPCIVLRPHEVNSDVLFIKRLLDIVGSCLLLVLLSPVFFLVAVAIKVTTPRASIFYPWRVVGQNGVEFTGYKFTTMVADADQHRERLESRNEMSGPVFKIKNDPRVTPLGRFLRKFSLNELPQLWSVFCGDMSLVGPRPAFRHELERYELWHKRKLSVKPGITCLWQVRGRNKINNFDEWVRMDLEYIDNWSLWFDFKILVRTAWVVVKGTGS